MSLASPEPEPFLLIDNLYPRMSRQKQQKKLCGIESTLSVPLLLYVGIFSIPIFRCSFAEICIEMGIEDFNQMVEKERG